MNLASEEANGVDEAAASVAANNASQMAAAAAANAAAWSQYTAAMGGHNPYEAWTQQQQPQQINGAQAPASTSEDPNATATTAVSKDISDQISVVLCDHLPSPIRLLFLCDLLPSPLLTLIRLLLLFRPRRSLDTTCTP